MTIQEKVEHMLDLQRKLDARILAGKPYPREAMVIALHCELSEVMECFPSLWKHWKQTAVDDPAAGLEEMADALHFMLSLLINEGAPAQHVCNLFRRAKAGVKEYHALRLIRRADIQSLMYFAKAVGFTFDDLYAAYVAKNKINHERQDRGY